MEDTEDSAGVGRVYIWNSIERKATKYTSSSCYVAQWLGLDQIVYDKSHVPRTSF